MTNWANSRTFTPMAAPENAQKYQKTSLHKDWIDYHASHMVRSLKKAGFTSYLVGGCVRDLLAGIHPKDFDIATAAYPQQVKRVIPAARIIGKRFRLVLVFRGSTQYEIATFRRDPLPDELDEAGEPLQSDNLFGEPEQDAKRRDFTINAIFYDPVEEKIIDYVEGMKDIEGRYIRMIGDPEARIKEDPIRILRAIRLAQKLDFTIEPALRAAVEKNAMELRRSVLPRRREELLKMLRLPNPYSALLKCFDLNVMDAIFPQLKKVFEHAEQREIFQRIIDEVPNEVADSNDPYELYAMLLLAYVRACTLESTDTKVVDEFLHKEDFMAFVREEVGMFNAEIGTVIRAIQTIPMLTDTEKWRSRGHKRLMSFVKSEYFPITLLMAQVDQQITADQTHFWYKAYREFLSRPPEPRPPRQPRVRKPKPAPAN